NGEGLAGQNDDTLGLLVRLKEPLAPDEEGVLTEAFWDFAPDRPTLRRTRPLASSVQVDTCARCHSHRHVLSDSYAHGRPLLDHFEPSTLDRDLYHPDGQILAEVYVYGSFVQSRMHREGVRCTDCHDPHSTRLRLEGNTLCTSCHVADHFDTPSHHHHAE